MWMISSLRCEVNAMSPEHLVTGDKEAADSNGTLPGGPLEH